MSGHEHSYLAQKKFSLSRRRELRSCLIVAVPHSGMIPAQKGMQIKMQVISGLFHLIFYTEGDYYMSLLIPLSVLYFVSTVRGWRTRKDF